jgi:hypothetical protein
MGRVVITYRLRFKIRVRTPSTHCIGGWVGLRPDLDIEARGKSLCLSWGSNPVNPVCSQTLWSQGSSVSIVSDCGLDDPAIKFDPRQRRKDFSSSLCVQTSSEAHPASCPMGTRGPFPGGKVQSRA